MEARSSTGRRGNGPQLVIDGYYGIQSQGDDAMLLALVEGIRERAPDVGVTVLSRNPRDLRRRYGLRALRNFDHPPFVRERGYWFYGFNPGQPRKHLAVVCEAIGRCDLLIIGGGNLLLDLTHDWLRGPLAWYSISSSIAVCYGVPYALFGMSIGPFRSDWGRARASAIVRGALEVGVRERESLDLACEMRGGAAGVALLPDPALRLGPDMSEGLRALRSAGWKPEAGRPCIAISVRDLGWLEKGQALDYPGAMARLCRRLIDELDALLVFVPQCACTIGRPEEDDRNVARDIARAVGVPQKCVLLCDDYRPPTVMGVYAHADATLTTRLHGAVFSSVVGTPVLALDYLPKVRGFLRELGLESSCQPLESLQDTDGMVARLEALLATPASSRGEVAARAAAAGARLDEQLDRFADVLQRSSR